MDYVEFVDKIHMLMNRIDVEIVTLNAKDVQDLILGNAFCAKFKINSLMNKIFAISVKIISLEILLVINVKIVTLNVKVVLDPVF